jgi:PAS domain-containing protein
MPAETLEQLFGPGAAVLAQAFDCFSFGVAVFASVRAGGDDQIADFACVYVNPAMETITGLPPDRFVGHRLLEVVPDFREQGQFDAYRGVVATGEPWESEIDVDSGISTTT